MNENDALPDPDVLVSHPEPGIAVLTLNRPAARNALSLAMMGALRDALGRAAQDASVSAIAIAAEGPAFSAGHDLKELTAHRTDADNGRAFFEQTMVACAGLMQGIVACPKPVIAAIEGVATAAGCQLVASCDLAVASDTAQFATPGVNIGLFCSTPMVALSRNVPRKHALHMLLLGDAMSAADAAHYGLINSAVPPGRALAEALGMARVIASKSQTAIAVGKAAFYRQIEMPLAAAYDDAVRVMVDNMLHADAEEGICAFIEKRMPVWRG